jgi:uncharacterized DUF497 family protein
MHPEKARVNEARHGVSFAEAIEVFADDSSSVVPDPDPRSYYSWRAA